MSRRGVFVGVGAAALVAGGVVLGLVLPDKEPRGSASTSPTTTTTVPEDRACVASYEVVNSWPDGFQVRVVVRNDGDRALTGWEVRWTLPDGEDIAGLWQGKLSRDGNDVIVTNEDYNVTVPAGESVEFGFNGSGDDPQIPPVSCREP